MTKYMLLWLPIHTSLSPAGSLTRAAVAMILRTSPSGPEVLLVERATRDDDPWSGDLGFPGGKIEASDGNEQIAAERETLEEVGLNLSSSRFLGRFPDIVGAHLPIRVSCFVYGLLTPASITLEDEINRAFWIPLQTLCDPRRHIDVAVLFGGTTMTRPAIRIFEPGKTVLWGITYRLVIEFLQRLDFPLASAVSRLNSRPVTTGHFCRQ